QEMLTDGLGGPVPNQALTPSDITQIDAYPSIVIYSGGNTENVEGLLTNIFGEGPLMDPETGRRLTESNPFLKSGFVTEENISGSSPSFGLINSGFLQIVEPDPDSNDTRRLPIYIVGVANGDSVIPEGDRLGIEENSQANFLWVPRVWSFSQAAAARITERD
ncbi:MAG: hypothetical protein HRT45_11765, partial [Bdellovibrionales bacterium]|nr:hypothetical protein [Bdellovibrionales bacterium]